jgi:hypothetical protein
VLKKSVALSSPGITLAGASVLRTRNVTAIPGEITEEKCKLAKVASGSELRLNHHLGECHMWRCLAAIGLCLALAGGFSARANLTVYCVSGAWKVTITKDGEAKGFDNFLLISHKEDKVTILNVTDGPRRTPELFATNLEKFKVSLVMPDRSTMPVEFMVGRPLPQDGEFQLGGTKYKWKARVPNLIWVGVFENQVMSVEPPDKEPATKTDFTDSDKAWKVLKNKDPIDVINKAKRSGE